MLNLKKKIEAIMNSRGNPPTPLLASLLHGFSIFYGAVQRLRATCYRYRVVPSRDLPCKVISIGNITVGGTGKTPMTIYLAEELRRIGYKAAIVSRGYGGGAERQGGIVSDGRTLYMESDRAGDEPYMMACRLKGVPVVVGKNRFAAGMLAVSKFQPDVILLDDAFQHLKLQRDVDIVLLDHSYPFGNTHLMPRGTLREPVSALARSGAYILTRYKTDTEKFGDAFSAAINRYLPSRPVFRTVNIPYCYSVKSGDLTSFHAQSDLFSPNELRGINDLKFFGFSGIAHNDDFHDTLKTAGFNVTGFLEFSDHHRYSEKDLINILQSAEDTGAHQLITTEKDYARISHNKPLPLALVVVGVKISFVERGQDFISFIRDRLQTDN